MGRGFCNAKIESCEDVAWAKESVDYFESCKMFESLD